MKGTMKDRNNTMNNDEIMKGISLFELGQNIERLYIIKYMSRN